MDFDQKKLLKELPSFFTSLLDEVHFNGFTLTLVGGGVRDYLLTGRMGRDWDVELTHSTIFFSKDDWKNFGKKLSHLGKITYLPYEIIRLEIEHYQFEFSPPRIESFLPDQLHHSNFTATFDYKLPFELAVARRDFTINAMGIRFHSLKNIEFLDPLGGLNHLKERILHPAGNDFSKDPVRFLRAHRFSEKLKYDFSPELKLLLDQMTVDGFTSAYLWSEMQKSTHALAYLERLIKEHASHPEMKLPVNESILARWTELKKILRDPSKHESWIIALEWIGVDSQTWQDYFSQKSDTCRRLARWARTSKYFQIHLPETFQGEFEDLRDTEGFEKLFDWYFSTKQLLQKNPEFPLLKIVEENLPEWIHLYRFEAPKDVKHIDPPYRAKYQVWNICQRL